MKLKNFWEIHESIVVLQGYAHMWFEWTLNYKPDRFYMTEEGYPLGTVCWYVMFFFRGVEGGVRVTTARDTLSETVLEAVSKLHQLLNEHLLAYGDEAGYDNQDLFDQLKLIESKMIFE